MKQKTLRVAGITNELEGASLYFNPLPQQVTKNSGPVYPNHDQNLPKQPVSLKRIKGRDRLNKVASNRDSSHDSMSDSNHSSLPDSLHANSHDSNHDSNRDGLPDSNIKNLPERGSFDQPVVGHEIKGGEHQAEHVFMRADEQDDLIDTIRRSVKKVGRAALYVRLALEEKSELQSIVRNINEFYSGQGGKTSENQVIRIAIKYLLEDHKKNGERSILSITEEALNA